MGSRQMVALRAALCRSASCKRPEFGSAFPGAILGGGRASPCSTVRRRSTHADSHGRSDAIVRSPALPHSRSANPSVFPISRRQPETIRPWFSTNRGNNDRVLPPCRCFTSSTGSGPKVSPVIDSTDELDEDEDDEEESLPFLGSSADLESDLRVDEESEEVRDASKRDGDDATAAPEGLFLRNTPLYELNFHYKEAHGLSSVSSHICAESKRTPNNDATIWSAVFTCPLSSKDYPSGTLRSGPPPVQRGDDTRVYYLKKQAAIHAAAARALDAIQHEILGIVEPRLCDEDPSTWSSGEQTHEASAQGIPSATRSSIESAPMPMEPTSVYPAPPPSPDDSVHRSETESDGYVGDGADWETEDEEFESDDESESVLEVVWVPVATRESLPASRILEAVSSSSPSALPDATSLENERVPLSHNPVQRLNAAVDRANAWCDAQEFLRRRKPKNAQRTIIASDDSSQMLGAGQALVASLAEAKQGVPVTSVVYKVEEAATRVLNILQSASSARSQSLDAEVYTSYLKCLEDPSPMVVAKRGEELVARMRAGESMNGSALPKPTIHTINALIQLHAQVGGTSGRYDRLEDDFRPNKESFLSILSSLIYRPLRSGDYRGFDVEFSRKCIKRMTELADETGDETLRPDTQVYNAPLRWYGGNQFRASRPYARVLRPDSFERRFAKGLLEKEDIYTREAIEMEAWLEEMRDSPDDRIKPDIETYEAIVQGWIRTATRRGLERAHAITEGLLSVADGASPRPRLQTFRPLVIAWALSSEPDAPTKIQGLLDLLSVAGIDYPELLPDFRMYQYLITSHVRAQSALIDKASAGVLEMTDLDVVRNSAQACERILDELCKKALSPAFDDFLEITPFEHGVFAWRHAAIATAMASPGSESDDSVGDSSTFDASIRSMMGVRELFEATLEAMKSSEVPGNLIVGNEAASKLSPQLLHLLRFAHRVHSTAIVSLLKIDAKLKVSCPESRVGRVPPPLLLRHFNDVDSMLRTSAECKLITDLVTKLGSESKLASLKARGRAVTPSESSSGAGVGGGDLPHGHYIPAHRLTYPDEMALVDLQLLPGWTQDSFIRYGVRYVRSISLDKDGGDATPRWVRAGDLVRLLVLLQQASAAPSPPPPTSPFATEEGRLDVGSDLQRRAVDDVQRVLNQLVPSLQDQQQPWRRMTSAIARAHGVGGLRGGGRAGAGEPPSSRHPRGRSRRPRSPKRGRRATASL